MSKEATKKSWEKWLAIVNGDGHDYGVDNCALCEEYHKFTCRECPINQYVDASGCKKTPYGDWTFFSADGPGFGIDRFRPKGVLTTLKVAIKMTQFIRKVYFETYGEPIEPIRRRGEK